MWMTSLYTSCNPFFAFNTPNYNQLKRNIFVLSQCGVKVSKWTLETIINNNIRTSNDSYHKTMYFKNLPRFNQQTIFSLKRLQLQSCRGKKGTLYFSPEIYLNAISIYLPPQLHTSIIMRPW